VRTTRLLAAAVLLLVAAGARAAGPWELAVQAGGDVAYRERAGQLRPTFGLQGWATLGPFATVFSYDADRRVTRPVDLWSATCFGAGLHLAPVPWLTLDAVGLTASVWGDSTDVNLIGWNGPLVDYTAWGYRLHATFGPRLGAGRFSDGSALRPVVSLTWTQLWADTDGDRFRTWGGEARFLAIGFALELVVPLRTGVLARGAP